MDGNEKRTCLRCGGELALYRRGYVDMRPGMLAPVEDWAYMELYLCRTCRRAEWVIPTTPLEEFEAQQEAQKDLSPVERFEKTFAEYSDRQLQKVVDGKDYVPEAKKAAQNLLCRRRRGE